MPLSGLLMPATSAYDPPVAGEGSLDPVGVAAISDNLADLLVPGLRARMLRVRFVTAMAVGAVANEAVQDEPSADGTSTAAICFEWLVVESLVRWLGTAAPTGVPGSRKARTVIGNDQRLSAPTYLKSPTVFGFHGVYKPFAVDSDVVDVEFNPGSRAYDLTRAWERDQGLEGFTDNVRDTDGGRLRDRIVTEVRAALREGRCVASPGSRIFGHLARTLRPDVAGIDERRMLRQLLTDERHLTRAELAHQLVGIDETLSEAEVIERVRPRVSATLGGILDAVVAYEQLAALLDAAFRTLCFISYGSGTQPLTVDRAKGNPMIVRAADELAERYHQAEDRIAEVTPSILLADRLGVFSVRHEPGDLVKVLMDHHDRVQAAKPPNGKRPWFEPFRDGWVVRPGYESTEPPELGPWFIHPVRIATLARFMRETADE